MPKLNHAICIILQLVYTVLLGQQFVLLEMLGKNKVRTAVSNMMALDTHTHTHSHACPGLVLTDLILSPHTSRVRHEVTPILLQDAALLICQGAQLPCAALQVCVQAAQTLSAP